MNRLTATGLDTRVADKINDQLTPAPSLERRRLRAYTIMLLGDAVLFHFGFGCAALVWMGRWDDPAALLAGQAMLPIYFTIGLYNGSYGARALSDWLFAARKAMLALVLAVALVNVFAFYTKSTEQFSRVSVTLGLILTAAAIIAFRRLIAVVVERVWEGRISNRLIIDDGGPGFPASEGVTIAAQTYQINPASHDPFMLDRLGKLLRNQDQVVVSCPPERREEWAFLLKSTGVHGEIVSEPAHRLGVVGVARYEALGRTTLVVSAGPLGLRARLIKRAFDVVVATAGLIALSPLLIGVALAIKLEDGGPVLFIQRRLGRGNQFFSMFKFRSMRVEGHDADGAHSTARGDDRITRIGAFIRNNSIDELPQLINVLRGEMSIVGPRPHALGSQANKKFFWEVDRMYWQRHCLKPGLTGLAQVRGHRGATEQEKDLTDRLHSDLEYIAQWSLRRDIAIVFRTVLVLSHKNAY